MSLALNPDIYGFGHKQGEPFFLHSMCDPLSFYFPAYWPALQIYKYIDTFAFRVFLGNESQRNTFTVTSSYIRYNSVITHQQKHGTKLQLTRENQYNTILLLLRLCWGNLFYLKVQHINEW